MQAEQRKKITGYFIEEAKEHLETIEQGILNFQSTIDDPEGITEVYRAAHSIKGGAAMLEMESIRHTAHHLEDDFKLLKEHPIRVDETLQSLCTRVLNGLKELIAELERSFTVADALAERVMSGIEPLFSQIQTHLTQLIAAPVSPHISTTPGNINPRELDGADEALDQDSLELGGEAESLAESASNKGLRSPAVGSAELSTLADLFEASELELQDDNITLIQSSDSGDAANLEDFLTAEDDSDFADLLNQFGDDNEVAGIDELDESGDISDFLNEIATESTSTPQKQGEIANEGSTSQDEFAFLGDLAAAEASANEDLDSSLSSLFGEDFSFEESATNENNLDEISALDSPLATPGERESNGYFNAENPQPDLEDLFSGLDPESTETGELAELELGEVSPSLDSLNGSSESLENSEGHDLNPDWSLDTLIQDSPDFSLDDADNFLDSFSQESGVEETSLENFDLDSTLSDLMGTDAPAEEQLNPQESVGESALEDLFAQPEPAAEETLGALEEQLSPQESVGENALEDLFAQPEPAAEETLGALEEQLSPQESAGEDALEDLFAPPEPAVAEDLGALEELLETPSVEPDPPTTPELSPATVSSEEAPAQPTAATGTAKGSSQLLSYYSPMDELEQLLEQPPADEIEDSALFDRLAALLEERPLPAEPEPVPAATPVSARPAPSPSGNKDDEFGDLEDLIKDIEQKLGGPPTHLGDRTKRKPRRMTVVEQTLKVPVKQMDNLNNLMGELVVNRNSLEGDEDKLRQSLDTLMHQIQNLSDVAGRMQDLYERSLLEDALLKSRQEYRSQHGIEHSPLSPREAKGGYDVLEMDSFTKFHELAQETIEMIVRVRESASDIALWVDDVDLVARSLRQVTSQLQEGLTKARMVPFSRTADRLPLAVRKICPQLNKQAQLYVEGKETLIDKMILEHLSDPLTHLVNNALTHGIEMPDERTAWGKRPVGQIVVRALQQGNQTVISVSDDGAGIDAQRVKAKAIEKGLITAAEARRLEDIEVYDLLFHAGFSTKDQADDFAGRGVGLDVVRTSISEIRGTVSIDSQPGKGTTFTIRLPLTLSICKALCCLSEHAPIAFPMDGVEDMLDLPSTHIQSTPEGYQYVQWRDIRLHYCLLSNLMTYHRKIGRGSLYASQREDDMVSVVVLRSATNFLAIGVDQVLGEQEIVIKQINGPVPKPAGIAGATVQGDGRIMAIADVLELIQIAEGRMRKDSSPFWQESSSPDRPGSDSEQTQPMVLIVDDSITVRSLLSMTFEKSGYQVEQARDGQDAWEKLRGGLPCDIVFCDIEMPRVDGLELLSRIQKDEQLNSIPVAMLTSRGAERHRRVAAEHGASGYFTKPYLEEVLLDAATRMMQGEVLLPGSTRPPGQTRSKAMAPPAQGPETAPPGSAFPQTEIHRQPKVLIVDDSVTVRSLLSMTFENAGYEVFQARDGQDAWNQLKAGLEVDLALLDIEMPKMDGLELLDRIQKDEQLNRIAVAMLTSRGAQKMRQRAAERGASAYFTKPYVEQELLDSAQRLRQGEVLLEGSTRQSRPTQPEPQPDPEPQPQPPASPTLGGLPAQPKVLIVDDSVTVRSLLSMTFENAGYEVFQARDGQDALDRLTSDLKVDVVFLDIEMPRMDGLTLLSNLQGDETLKDLPVAMLTSRGAKKMKQRASEAGAKGYFVKPYIEEVLVDAARRLINGEVLLTVEA